MLNKLNRIFGKKPSENIELTPFVEPSLVESAETEMKAGNIDAAVLLWQQVLTKPQAPGGAYMRLAACYETQKDFTSFEKTLREGSIQNPKHSKLRFRLFNYLFDNQRYDDAFSVFEGMQEFFDTNLQYEIWPKYARKFFSVDRRDLALHITRDGLKKWPGSIRLLEVEPEWIMKTGDYAKGLSLWEDLAKEMDERPLKLEYYQNILNRVENVESLKLKITQHRRLTSKKRFVIYSAIAGTYDDLKLPAHIDNRFDYVLFTDSPQPDTGLFDIKKLPYIQNDPTRSARYVKTHPHILLPEYDVAVWVDANVVITGDIMPYIEKVLDKNAALGVVTHPLRDTVYQEAAMCLERDKDSATDINRQMEYYKHRNFDGTGLIESNFLVYNLTQYLTEFCKIWWNQINSYSRRDQLSYGYAALISDIKTISTMDRPNSTRSSKDFILVPHNHATKPNQDLMQKLTNSTMVEPKNNPLTITSGTTLRTTINVIVCVHNALEEVRKCLASIEQHKTDQLNTLIIIDDGSAKPTKDYLQEFATRRSWVNLKRKRSASGYTIAANRGLRESSSDFVILLNSDTIVTKNWLHKMTTALHSYPNVGLVGPLSSAASHQSIPQHLSASGQTAVNDLPDGIDEETMNQHVEEWATGLDNPIVPLVHGFCFGINRKLIDSIGYFNESDFPKGYGEENDYCMRAADSGFHMVIAIDTYIYHAKSKSYADSNRRIQLMKSGSERLQVIYSKERIERAIKTMQTNPALTSMRNKAQELYK